MARRIGHRAPPFRRHPATTWRACSSAAVSSLPGERRAARIVADLARQILDLDGRISDIDGEITGVFRGDERAKVIESLPGMGPILGAEFLAVVTDLSAYKDAGHLAACAGLAPVPRACGRRTGSRRRPRHYDRRLRRLFYLSAQTAMARPGNCRDYRKKRSEGLICTQAVLCLAGAGAACCGP